MSVRRKNADWLVVAGVVLCLSLLAIGGYAWAYVTIGEYLHLLNMETGATRDVREFKHDWQVTLFAPATRLESVILGMEIEAVIEPPP